MTLFILNNICYMRYDIILYNKVNLCKLFFGKQLCGVVNDFLSLGVGRIIKQSPKELFMASDTNHMFYLSVLFPIPASGQEIDLGDQFGRTPLMFTILADRLECAELLLRAGANVNCKDKGGRTALHWAAHKVCGLISTKYGLIYLFIVYRSTSHLVFFNTVLKDYHYGEGL